VTRVRGRLALVLLGVLAAAFLLRYLIWLRMSGPVTAVDSATYLMFARAIARGDFGEFARLPFYLLYPLTLAPMYALSLPEAAYIQWLHLLASTATVWCLYRIGARVVSEPAGLLVAAAAAVYPFFLFWLPYVLTETLFLLCLAAYVDVYLRFLDEPRATTGALYLFICAAFVLSRPSAVVCVAFSWIVLAAAIATRRWGATRGIASVAIVALLAVGAAAVAVAASPALRSRILSIPTIGQTLWASTKYSTGNLEELRRFEALDQEMHRRFVGPERERNEYAFKVREAAQFIVQHPSEYLRIVARKMIAYWFPWAFADTWSLSHRLLDAAVSIGLSIGVLLSLKWRAIAPWPLVALTMMAASFGLLSAFGQIDPDARYRLPAELIALILAVAGLAARSGHPITARSQ